MTTAESHRHAGLMLVVDDDPIARLLARESLEQDGWGVEEADNGRHALDAFERVLKVDPQSQSARQNIEIVKQRIKDKSI